MYHVENSGATAVINCFEQNQIVYSFNSKYYGLKGATGNLLTECPANCQKCMSTACDACDMGFALQGTTCISQSNIPDNFGLEVENNVLKIKPCKDVRCKDCKVDTSVCITCKADDNTVPVYEYRTNQIKTCYVASELPDGVGAQLSNMKTAWCVPQNCQSC